MFAFLSSVGNKKKYKNFVGTEGYMGVIFNLKSELLSTYLGLSPFSMSFPRFTAAYSSFIIEFLHYRQADLFVFNFVDFCFIFVKCQLQSTCHELSFIICQITNRLPTDNRGPC